MKLEKFNLRLVDAELEIFATTTDALCDGLNEISNKKDRASSFKLDFVINLPGYRWFCAARQNWF